MERKTQPETCAEMPPNKGQKLSPHHSPEREDRVAAALRENLRKRKAQMQTRVAPKDNE